MPHDPKASFNAEAAARYDEHLRGDEEIASRFLAELASDGPVLEFAIGTGRIALPLTEAGIKVDGIELSEAQELQKGNPDGLKSTGVCV